MEAQWMALHGLSTTVLQNTIDITTEEHITNLEQRLAYLARAERADLALLRSRPYIQFRNAVIAHLEQPGSSTLKEGYSVVFWNSGLCINVLAVGDGVTVWTGINECGVG